MKNNIPWFNPEIAGSELSRLSGVLDSAFLNDGRLTSEFEMRVATIAGTDHAVAVTSGTAAITLALMALGIGAGDVVIVPNLTFIATANAARLAGAEVCLVDVETQRFGLDPEALTAALSPRVRAVITVDVNGRGANYRFIESFCRTHGLKLVCDAAEALGSRYDARPIGSFGDAACFSFSPNKTITTGQGGMVTTNDAAVAARLRELKDQGRPVRGTGGDDAHPTLGFNFKFTDIQAAVGLAQLEKFEERLAAARQRDIWYRDRLADCPGLQLPDMDSEPGEVRQWTDVLLDRREDVRAVLTREGVGHRAFWHPIHTQQPYANPRGRFDNSIRISERGLWLPSHFSLTQDQVETTANLIRSTLS